VGPLLTPGQRDRSRAVLMALSAAIAAAVVTATGGATAIAAQETARAEAEKARARAAEEAEAARRHHEELVAWAADNPVVVTTPKPVRTVVGPTVVQRASAPGTAAVGGSPSTRGRQPSAPATGAPVAPAPPPPPPVTSTGS
jgi:hypothetical protein